MIPLIERGHTDSVALRTLQDVLAALDASITVEVRWPGGEIDPVLDERHAAFSGRVVGELTGRG